MVKCNFCNDEIRKGRGIMLVKNDGKIFWFCSSKCRKSHNIGRNPKRVKWVVKKKK